MTEATPIGLVGNLTGDPEMRYSRAGRPWLRCRLAVQPYVKGADEQPPVEFYDVVAFGSLAENAVDVIAKGSRVVVTGRLEHETWTDKAGNERTTAKVVADGLGLDLRFTTGRTSRSAPPSATPTLDSLVGPAQPRSGYQEEPF